MWAIFQTIKGSWLKHIVTQLSALFILTATYSVALFIILSTSNVKNIFNIWGKINEATVYMSSEVNQENQKVIEQYFSKNHLVESYVFETSKTAAQSFNEKFKNMTSQSIDPKNISQFFPAIYKVKFKGEHIYREDSALLDGFAATIQSKFPFVAEVSYGKSWLRKYEKIMTGLERTSWFIVFIIIATSLFVSSNVIKTVLFSKRDEIEILEFVGAGQIWIYGPHIINICVISSLSFFFAVLINYSLYQFSYDQVYTTASSFILKEVEFLSPLTIGFYFLLILMGVIFYSLISISSLMPKNSKKTVYVDGSH